MKTQFDKVFLGITPADQRRFLTAALRYLKPKFPRIVIPAVGSFTLAKCAREAGYDLENIFTSDISLFSSLLGYLYSGKAIADLGFVLAEEYRERYEACVSDVERVATLLWVMKTKQLKPDMFYERVVLDDLIERREEHIARLVLQIEAYKGYYGGIQYEIADMRTVLEASKSPDTLTIVNPPVFKSGYSKLFDFGSAITWSSGVAEFDFAKEYRDLYAKTKVMTAPHIFYRWRDVKGFDPRDVIFCKEIDVGKRDYWLITKPDELKDFRYGYTLDSMSAKGLRPYSAPIFSNGDELQYDSKIRFVSVSEDVALYYRDLFAHKLGNTHAESYFLCLIDGKVFGVIGFMTTALFRLQTDRVFESFGFNAPVSGLPRANRLLMMAITCKEFADVIYHTASRVNRVYRLKGLRTTCLSKYRRVKLNQGILTVLSCERIREGKANSGLYKISYDCDFHDQTFVDVLRKFIDEERAITAPASV